MSPTLLFELTPDGERGPAIGAVGSPGGSVIIQYVVKAIVGMTDWGLDPQQTIAMVNFGAENTPTTGVGGEHPLVADPEGQAVLAALATRCRRARRPPAPPRSCARETPAGSGAPTPVARGRPRRLPSR